MTHLFPYREEGNPPLLRPTLDVRLQHGATGDWSCRALIDTGSPLTIFDRGVADALALRIRPAGAKLIMLRLLGGNWQAQVETVDLTLLGAPEIHWTAEVAFVLDPTLQMPFQGLLGTQGFLDKFAVTFNKYYDQFIVEPPDQSADRHAR